MISCFTFGQCSLYRSSTSPVYIETVSKAPVSVIRNIRVCQDMDHIYIQYWHFVKATTKYACRKPSTLSYAHTLNQFTCSMSILPINLTILHAVIASFITSADAPNISNNRVQVKEERYIMDLKHN